MEPSSIPDNFYLYLWRSPNLPGTLYLAKGFETTEALCRGLIGDGYIVKVIQMGTDIEFELFQGKLRPISQTPASPGVAREGPHKQGPPERGMSSAFA
jgi:hypothetical protein